MCLEYSVRLLSQVSSGKVAFASCLDCMGTREGEIVSGETTARRADPRHSVFSEGLPSRNIARISQDA